MLFDKERLPAPDEHGYFCHPDVPGEDEGDDVHEMLLELGYESKGILFELDAPSTLVDDYYERDNQSAVARWEPTEPTWCGDGWALVAKCETEDGPCALFVRPTKAPNMVYTQNGV